MVNLRNSTSIDHQTVIMANPLMEKLQHNRNRKQSPSGSSPGGTIPSSCGHHSRTAVIDVVILIAVIGACGFLVYPYVKIIFDWIVEIGGFTYDAMKTEVIRAPMVYVFLGLSMFFTFMAAWMIYKCSSIKCGKPNCLGLRKAAEFDIQIETEDSVKKSSNSSVVKEGSGGKGLLQLSIDRHRELEAELRKIAPPNGRAVLVFRARCGCSVGRMEVPGGPEPKKQLRKVKK
ncbi:hypothetical protein C5167_031166 [Papaver somniferum]|uniref:uncharacterized protein At5g19025-like n=1 Tax=Papaver somniferum TaxID=3469 RepID=UPI000E6F4E34|nr:uncharacterized protein At5g19025-like [Papaver somniferum]RZC88793.1 hypothetical protein C5167_031166 [Papaver somniferum]